MVRENEPNKFTQGFLKDLHELINSPVLSQRNFKSIFTELDSLRLHTEQSRGIFDQVIKASTLSSSVLEALKLSAPPGVSKTLASQSNLAAFDKIKLSPIFEEVSAANLSISKLMKEVDSSNISNLMQQTIVPSTAWKQQLQAIDTISDSFQRYDLVLKSHLAGISTFSALSQISVSHLALEGFIGNTFKIKPSIQSILQNTFVDFAKSYSKLFASFSDKPASVISLPPIVSRYSAVEFFNGVRVAEAVTIESDESELDFDVEQEIHQLGENVREEAENVLEELLRKLNPDFIVPLHGARQSFESTNPDKVRHVATSLRELFTHVLHALSPDDKVKDWSNSPEHYYNNRPTRRARLLYICRSLNYDQFSNFLEKDIDTVLEFLKLFQRGTHEIMPTYTDLQLRVMLIRMESTLRFLLEIGMESNIT